MLFVDKIKEPKTVYEISSKKYMLYNKKKEDTMPKTHHQNNKCAYCTVIRGKKVGKESPDK